MNRLCKTPQTPVLITRIKEWLNVCQIYCNYYQELLAAEQQSGKQYKSMLKTLYVDGSDPQIQLLLKHQQTYHSKLITASQNKVHFLKNETIPTIKSLISSIESFIKSFTRASALGLDDELVYDADLLGKLIDEFHTSLNLTTHDKALGNKSDPWLIYQNVRRHLVGCVFKQTSIEELMLKQQREIQEFITNIHDQIQLIQKSYLELSSTQNIAIESGTIALSVSLSDIATIPTENFETFFTKNFSQNEELVSFNDLPFLDFTHPLLETVSMGELSLSHKGVLNFMKVNKRHDGFKSFFTVFSSDGYLHVFEQPPERENNSDTYTWYYERRKSGGLFSKTKHISNSQLQSLSFTNSPIYRDPIHSIYLPSFNCFRTQAEDGAFELVAKPDKQKIIINTSTFIFKARDIDTSDFWFDLITEKTRYADSSVSMRLMTKVGEPIKFIDDCKLTVTEDKKEVKETVIDEKNKEGGQAARKEGKVASDDNFNSNKIEE